MPSYIDILNLYYATQVRETVRVGVLAMVARISTQWSYKGMKTVILENDAIRTVVLVDYGAKILEFTLKKKNRDLLYYNPRVEIRTPVYGVNVDNWWHGGIDECIPTGQPIVYRGEKYPYLGELWSLPWSYEIAEGEGFYCTSLAIYSDCSASC
ncbi:MAG: hypothetical protein ABSD49_03530 [Candidatus Bathyarchaeia archaeon]